MSQSRRNSRRKSNTDKTPQLRKRTSSKFHHSFIRAKLKLTNTKQSLEPTEITEAKLRLKSTKNITTSLEPIVNNLYWAQHEHSRLMSELSNTLTNITINNNNDKFGIFLKNMGRVQQNLEEIDEMYLINMKDQFLDPLKEFNATQIKKCQQTKLKLKTIKGQFDLKKKSETKLLKTQSEKRISLDKVHSVQTATSKKLNELLSVRDEFVSCVNTMEKNKLHLLSSFAEYMDSFMAYSKMHSTNIELQTKSMNVMPPKIAANKSQLDSDTEECFMNDFNEQQKTLNDWGKSSVVVKEGIFKKRGAVNKSFKKRWFKLFTNKKLTYFDINDYGNGPNGMLKGHANLTNIVQINTKKNSLIEIQTKTRKWIFSYDNIEDRDEWYNIFQQTCVQNVTRTMKQTANDFGDMFIDGNGNNNNNNKLNIIIPSAPIMQAPIIKPNAMNTKLMQSHSGVSDVNVKLERNISISEMTIARCDIYKNKSYGGNNNKQPNKISGRNIRRFRFNYPSRVRNCTVLNNGHTVQINVDMNENKCLFMYGNKTYFLQSFNFHTPAEHMIDGKRYEMECHLVHTNKYNETVVLGFVFSSKQKYKQIKNISGHRTRKTSYHLLAPTKKKPVVNVPEFTDDEETDGETDDESDMDEKYDLNKGNEFLTQFWDDLPLRETKQGLILKKSLRFDYLFETASNNFSKNFETNEMNINLEVMEYTGSLTIPPYTEKVQWIISKKINFIGLKQLNKLSLCWGQL